MTGARRSVEQVMEGNVQKRWTASLVVAVMVAVSGPSRAEACYDGYEANVRNAAASVGFGSVWHPEVARHVATWLTRVDALLPAGVTVTVYPWSVECEGKACATTSVALDVRAGFKAAFAATARNVGADARTMRRAGALAADPVTVQVYAGSQQTARAIAERISNHQPGGEAGENWVGSPDDEGAANWSGFYEAGGFPAFRPAAHVVRATLPDGSVVHRVVVGAFLTVADAEVVRASVEAATGARGFVRPLAGVGSPIARAAPSADR
jgi:hypothetical protein